MVRHTCQSTPLRIAPGYVRLYHPESFHQLAAPPPWGPSIAGRAPAPSSSLTPTFRLMTQSEITIRGERIPCTDDRWPIGRPLFLRENPRVYSSIVDVPNFDDLLDDQKQQIIYEKLLGEPSVKTLIPDIRRNGGLIEPILVRADRRVVVEGNSRLAAYRYLYAKYDDDKWSTIPCRLVSRLTNDQQAALLHYIHVKGKTSWTRYEKAHFTYIQHKIKGKTIQEVAKLFSISTSKAYQDIRIIQSMKDNNDRNRTHFSYYSVLETTLKQDLKADANLKSALLSMIRPSDDHSHDPPFTAQNLRDQLPVVLKKPKILRKFVKGEVTLDTAHDRAKISDTQSKMKQIRSILNDITGEELRVLSPADHKAVVYECRKVKAAVSRIRQILQDMNSQ